MSDDFSARLALPYLAAGQMQKHVTLNAALTRLDALLQTLVLSRTTAAQPEGPADGALYILPEGATGAAWGGRPAGTLMRFEAGGWSMVPISDGLIALIADAGEAVVRVGGAWRPLGERLGVVQDLTRLGVGTTADANNPVAIKVNAALMTARGVGEGGDGDLRLKLNKEGAADVLSLLFQSGWGGRAELGLIGDDDLSLKVSADGGTWRRAFAVDRATGRVAFDQGAARLESAVFTGAGVYTPPVWARWIEIACIGGGGGGGAGQAGAAGTARLGGGGGGAGGRSEARWARAALTGDLTITPGGGGAGGASSGASGQGGGETTVILAGKTLLKATGGAGGAGASTAAASGGLGGLLGNSGGGSSTSATATAGEERRDPFGPGGGGGGGGLDTGNTARGGGKGGIGAVAGSQAAAGNAGAAGQGASTPDLSPSGGGGGGGAAAASGAGQAGGAGGAFGAGGGGGGAGQTAGGVGGQGGAGVVRVTAIG
ncbi:DUF2793 domain-containing protein [Brevundimonas sp. SORGH_AS_0993]|uniref:DUF2793 domain-containing protein n=1 Tax=Brevundimonas sp. SORGH_AS_0993 TaxID=3041794 RepID=UPI00278AC28F|nr:DUF2793 domain-containing protein [Brevundimonas sp. SORGH_AS_0993]MDQ1154017.1 hypothetical protein [Brevundimonas sp. SORGH_AS_0993]